MKYSIIFTTVITLALTSQLVTAGSIADTYAAGDTLTATKMENIKTAVNDNDNNINLNTTNIGINNDQISTLLSAQIAAAGSISLTGSTISTTPETLDEFTVSAPGPGTLLVQVAGQWFLDADSTTTSSITVSANMGLCDSIDSSTDCDGTWSFYFHQDADNSESLNNTHGFTITRIVPIASQQNITFYLNGLAPNSTQRLNLYQHVSAHALFFPSSLTVTSP